MKRKKAKKAAINFPHQPCEIDKNGVFRFKENRIVRKLLDLCWSHRIFDLNDIAALVQTGVYTKEERDQLRQLIGYSISGFLELDITQGSRRAANYRQRKLERRVKK